MNLRALTFVAVALLTATGCAVSSEADGDLAATGGDPTVSQDDGEEKTETTSQAFSVTSTTFLLERVGGTGGTAGVLRCNDSRDVIVGLRGRAGNVIDQLGLICARLNADGSTGPAYTTGALGGNGGTGWSRQCEPNGVVRRIDAWSATYVDGLQIVCANAPFPNGGYYGGFRAGGYGGPLTTLDCNASYVMTSINVRTGNVVDAIQPRCTYVGTN